MSGTNKKASDTVLLSEDSDVRSENERSVERENAGEDFVCDNLDLESRRLPEKRGRPYMSSEESKDEGEFTTVQRPKKKNRKVIESEKSTAREEYDLEESYEVCVISRQILPKQIGLAKLLRAEQVQNISRIKYKNPYKVLINFDRKEDAEKLINCEKMKELDYRCQYTHDVNLVYGTVKEVDLDVDVKELMEEYRCDSEIVSIKRLKRMKDGAWIDSETVRICFRASTLPPYVKGYGCTFKVESYTFPVSQCSGCWRYGHSIRVCPSMRTLCPKCGDNHVNCETKDYVCINCKGPHMSFDKSRCPVFAKEKKIRNIMSQNNLTYRKALALYLEENKEKVMEEEEIVMDVSRNNVTSNIPSSLNRSYRDVLIEHAIVHREESSKEESETEVSNYQNDHQVPKNKKSKQKTKIKKSKSKPEFELQNKQDDIAEDTQNDKCKSTNRAKPKFNISIFLNKCKDILLGKKSLEDKVSLFFQLIVEEVISFVMYTFKDGEIFKKLFNICIDG
ncbi:hypothetical protein JYU34_008174 [Plutella xylostella]|uniref:Gag-like protein n=1 Tax=Plutella xylostella TaxID=51655 RepID=A0ABQ7QNW6_PLUXY|nr:hypothetical protein JYU34_008174 [Plutella xylostella]